MMIIFAKLKNGEKFDMFKNLPEHSTYYPWLISLGIIIAAMIAAVLVVHFIKTSRREKTRWRKFDILALEGNLTASEIEVAKKIDKYNFMSDDHHAVLSLETVFNDGVENYLASGLFEKLDRDEKREVINDIESIREKLSMNTYQQNKTKAGTNVISVNEIVKIVAPKQHEIFSGVVKRISESSLEISLSHEQDLNSSDYFIEGIKCKLQYSSANALWEFNSKIVSHSRGILKLEHVASGNVINRRRFERVNVSFPAKICCYDFSYKGSRLFTPRWIDAKLMQIAGPGLKVRAAKISSKKNITNSPVLSKHSKVLIIAKIREKLIVQSLGTVRRIEQNGVAFTNVAVELVNLTNKQKVELSRATDYAARLARDKNISRFSSSELACEQTEKFAKKFLEV